MEPLNNPLAKLTLLFLNFILPMMNDFNKLFQADETRISFLLPEMNRLLRKHLVKFVSMRLVKPWMNGKSRTNWLSISQDTCSVSAYHIQS